MDVTCSNCGASNRSTSRFCARCGQPLPSSEEAGGNTGEELNLPWLQAVQDRAVHQTGQLRADRLRPENEPPQTPTGSQAEQSAQAAQQDAQAEKEQAAAPQDQAASEAPAEQPKADEAPPEWVVSILEPDTAPNVPQESYEPEELAHIMPWLTGPAGAVTPGSEAGLPPWLSGMTVQETLETRTADKPTGTNEMQELEDIQPFVPPEIEQEAQQAPTPAEADTTARPQEQVPDWLKRIAPAAEDKPKEETQPPIQRTTPVTRVVLTPTDTLSEAALREVPVRPPRQGAVETLAALLQAAPEAVVGPGAAAAATVAPLAGPTQARGFRSWLLPDGLIYIVILLALLGVLLAKPPFGQVNAPAAADAIQFYNAVDSAPTGKPALVVFDWDATRSAEMSALSAAVINHLMSRHVQFVTISTVAQGPGFAQQITQAAANNAQANYGYVYGRDYLVLGYLPGGEASLRALSGNFSTVLPVDYVNNGSVLLQPIAAGGKLSSLDSFGIIIDLAADETALRTWIEQVAVRTKLPIVAGVPQALEPLARPYKNVRGAGLAAVVSGQAGALQYEQQLAAHGLGTAVYTQTALSDRLNALSVAEIIVALVIVAAFISMGTRRIIRR